MGPGETDAAIKPVDVTVSMPEPGNESALAIFNGERAVRIGDSEKLAFETFPKPAKAFENDDKPMQLGGEFKARSWTSSTETFGVITLDGRVALAMKTLENASAEQLANIISSYSRAISVVEPKSVSGHAASYWFWELGTQRLMVCKSTDYKGRNTVTVAVGDEKLMNLLRMNPTLAAKDLARAQQILQQREALQ